MQSAFSASSWMVLSSVTQTASSTGGHTLSDNCIIIVRGMNWIDSDSCLKTSGKHFLCCLCMQTVTRQYSLNYVQLQLSLMLAAFEGLCLQQLSLLFPHKISKELSPTVLGLRRDIKAENVLLTSSGEAKLSDFGLGALAPNQLEAEGRLSNFAGTAYCAAPEVLSRKQNYAGAPADIWGLGKPS